MKENELTLYLLGLLSESKQTQLELRLLSDTEAYEQLLLAEEDLMEAYLQDELSPHEKARFERIFLAHPTRRQHVALAQALQSRASVAAKTHPTPVMGASDANGWQFFRRLFEPPIGKFALAAAVVVVAILGVRYFLHRTQSPSVSAPPIVMTAPTSPPQKMTVGTETLSEELSSGQVMAIGSEKTILRLTDKIGQVKLRLWLQKDGYETYQVALQTYDPELLKELPGELQRQGGKDLKFIEITLPVTALPGQEFMLKLYGLTASGARENADTFNFKVKRE